MLRFFIFHSAILCLAVAYFTFISALLLASSLSHGVALGLFKFSKVPTFSEKVYLDTECLNAFMILVYPEG